MKIPEANEVNRICEEQMKEYVRNYDKCVVACMSDEVLLGMKDLICESDKRTNKRGDRMTTNIEQKFFEAFSIKEVGLKDYNYDTLAYSFKTVEINGKRYPKITSDILLQLLCIVIDEYEHNGHTFYLDAKNIEELKSDILDALMGCIDATSDLFDDRVKQVQSLFTEVLNG